MNLRTRTKPNIRKLGAQAEKVVKRPAPHRESTREKKCFAVLPRNLDEYHTRIVRIDRLVNDLLIEGIYTKAQPTLDYGKFEVSDDIVPQFRQLAANHGLALQEVMEV